METLELNNISLKNTEQVLLNYKDQLISLYRQNLQENGITDSPLANNISADININNNIVTIILNLEDYWKYVEYGRGPGKFPPIVKIKDWIEKKNIIPREYNGKLPTVDQLSYLIARKISNEGIPGKHILAKTKEQLDILFKQEFENALQQDFNNYFQEILTKINNMLTL